MGRPAVLKIDIVADAKGVGGGVAQADKQLGGLGAGVRKHAKAIGVGLAGVGIVAVKFGKDSAAAFRESQQASAQLDDALARFPTTNDRTRASFDKLNASLALKTKFDDDATASGQAVLAQFHLTGAQIQQLTPLMQDYAAKTGRDLPAAAGVLGKALLGKGKALQDVGLKLKDAGSVTANYDQLVSGLSANVGGFAVTQEKAAGGADVLSNQFGELQETVGSKVVPWLTRLTTAGLAVVGFMQRNSRVAIPLVAVLGTLAGAVFLINKAAKAYAATQAALNVIMSLNPIALVVIAVVALTAGIVLLWRRSETFRTTVKKLWDVLKTFIGFSPFGLILSHLDDIWNKIKDIGSALKNNPISKGLGKVGGWAFGHTMVTTGSPQLVGTSGDLAGAQQRLATAAVGDPTLGVLTWGAGGAGGGVVLDQRDQRTFVRAEGAIDPVGTAETVARLLASRDVRQGRQSAWGSR